MKKRKQDLRDLNEPLFISEIGEAPIPVGVYEGRHFDIIAEQGDKSPGDRKLYMQPHNGGPRIPLDWCDMARAFCFMCHGESINNDPAKGFLGANKVRQFFRKAMETNVLVAAAQHGIPQGKRVDCNARWAGEKQ